MAAIVFLILCIAFMVFLFMLSRTMTDEFRLLFTRLIDLIPRWDGDHDIKSFIFCFTVMLFILGLVIVVFR